MTIIDVSRKLLSFFAENDVFKIKDDFSTIVPITLDEETDKGIVMLALDGFVKQDIVRPLYSKPNNPPYAFVLSKPLAEYSQTIEISYPVISALTKTVNDFCDALDLKKGKVNPLSVNENDIESLTIIIDTLKNQLAQYE